MSAPALPPSPAPQPPSVTSTRLAPLAGIVFALFLALGLASCAWALLSERLSLWPERVDRHALLEGELTHHIAKELAKAPLPEAATRLERGASWLLLGDTGPRVRQGCPGWLFLAEELDVPRQAAANARARAQTVIELRQQLAAWHIQLLVTVVPDKSRIAADQLCSLHRPAAFASRVADWTRLLSAAQVPVLDLTAALAPLGSAAFLRTDTHWNETGAETAARALATHIQALPFHATPARAFSRTHLAPAPRPGDLVRLAGLDWLPPRLQPAPEVLRLTQVDSRAAAGASDDLFGDGDLPNVAVIGTSFSRNSNFLPFLEQALGASVGRFAKDGGHFAGAARDYFDGPAFRQTPPQLLVWEIPERDLQSPRPEALRLDPRP
ncbi:alginate O-acetyltransferase AlgX-related protein [Pseudomonas oryzihabitans]|uniref:alginate O-acetyltransferase AlgX-related protein n=1 Tax=Pseudomonas oryzihabitans TaxID=47885 RepID=UPI00135F098F|nr:cell division protein FtsQ [Pseudomonas oryzihabitans]MXS20273.1 cell division protein FtsQ [Pseudomonas oryzihabitans]